MRIIVLKFAVRFKKLFFNTFTMRKHLLHVNCVRNPNLVPFLEMKESRIEGLKDQNLFQKIFSVFAGCTVFCGFSNSHDTAVMDYFDEKTPRQQSHVDQPWT